MRVRRTFSGGDDSSGLIASPTAGGRSGRGADGGGDAGAEENRQLVTFGRGNASSSRVTSGASAVTGSRSAGGRGRFRSLAAWITTPPTRRSSVNIERTDSPDVIIMILGPRAGDARKPNAL